MAYLVSRKPYLETLYDQVYHIKYESVDHVLVEEICKIIKAKTRNPEHEKHEKWLARCDQAIQDVSQDLSTYRPCHNRRMLRFRAAHFSRTLHVRSCC